MRAIILGATGLIGNYLLQQILSDAVYSSVKIIVRRPLHINHPKLHETVLDFDNETAFEQAITDADVLFCCVGTTQKKVKGDKAAYRKVDVDIPVNAAKFCAANSVGKYVLVSAVGANIKSSNFYLHIKAEAEESVLKWGIPMVYIMRPSIILGQRNETRLLETLSKIIMQIVGPLFFGNLAKYRAIQAKNIAAAMIVASEQNIPGQYVWEYREMMNAV